jgi:SAM-dependent methyltransferase
VPAGDALVTYEAFAPYYDAFTRDYQYASWMSDIDAWARECGLAGRRLLDAACGTGNSFIPMLDRGYEVVACDLSPAMVSRARRKAKGRAEVVVADLRALPWCQRFDLVTCVDDSLNYLLSTADLVAALRSIHDALEPGGLAAFDFNSLSAYRTTWAGEFTLEAGDRRFRWRGEGSEHMPPGGLASATIELVAAGETLVTRSRHVQRHHSIETVELACLEVGLEVIEMRGESPEEGLVPEPDEDAHLKIACMVRRRK